MASAFDLKGKVAVVTGGYGHLGKEMCLALSQAGAKVIVAGRDKNKFNAAFRNRPASIHFVSIDILSSPSIKRAFKTVMKSFGSIDILVNNAIHLEGQDPERITDAQWEKSIAGTLSSVYYCIREILPYMKKKGGSIINISSMYGMVAPDFAIYKGAEQYLNPPHYGAAKAGVIQLTKYYASYLAKYGIRVNCISPGSFPSPMVQKHKKFIKALSEMNPLGRIGSPKELGGPVVYLASNASSYVTGQNLVVDGGWTIN